jgi:hypothetical protein
MNIFCRGKPAARSYGGTFTVKTAIKNISLTATGYQGISGINKRRPRCLGLALTPENL